MSGWSVASKTFVDASHYTIVLEPTGCDNASDGANGNVDPY